MSDLQSRIQSILREYWVPGRLEPEVWEADA